MPGRSATGLASTIAAATLFCARRWFAARMRPSRLLGVDVPPHVDLAWASRSAPGLAPFEHVQGSAARSGCSFRSSFTDTTLGGSGRAGRCGGSSPHTGAGISTSGSPRAGIMSLSEYSRAGIISLGIAARTCSLRSTISRSSSLSPQSWRYPSHRCAASVLRTSASRLVTTTTKSTNGPGSHWRIDLRSTRCSLTSPAA
mmetsp:Transcript_105987/g.276799  ORF Transcript_105987/g.276799 Transcript_105987/m.276799 type:complete len:200 (-) Transcript_105987:640-1239(-)